MQYIYHGVPEQMVGYELVPLNHMRDALSTVRDTALEKYKGRAGILERKIPLLDCLWNDVLQFTPVHPRKAFELQVQLGLIPKMPHYEFYEIDLATLDPKKTVVYFKTAAGEENVRVQWLRDVDFDALQQIPPATIKYYKTLVGTGELPFNYQFIPHILYQGTVDISKSPVIAL